MSKPVIDFNDSSNPFLVAVSISNKHLHLSREMVDILFGQGYSLHCKKELTQPGQFAAEETVTLIGPKGSIEGLRIIGPERSSTQVELAQTDARRVGIVAPLRESGDLAGSGACRLIGPMGELELTEGVIIAAPHIHLSPADAEAMGLKDGDLADLYLGGIKPMMMYDVLVRSGSKHARDIHLDTDEANAAQYSNGKLALVIPRK